jgi:iron complex outermembrane receptor protein
MDGVSFQRQNLGLAFETRDLSPRVGKLEGQAYLNEIDHIMDNGTLRPFLPSPGHPEPMAGNPRRITRGARFAVSLYPGGPSEWILGADTRSSRLDWRGSRSLYAMPVAAQPRVPDAVLDATGLFGQWTRAYGGGQLVAGLRADQWRAEDLRAELYQGPARVPNPTAGATREPLLLSGFFRSEWSLGPPGTTLFAGLGQVRRFPDYWELIPVEAATSPSAFQLSPERTTQLDAGATLRSGRITTSFSGFYSIVSEYILIQSGFPKAAPSGPRLTTVARNIQARTWGGELALAAALSEPLRLDASLAWTQGENRTDDRPLAQMPPLEARLGLAWEAGAWSCGSLARLVAPQDRFALGQGTIAGEDLGRSPGFAVFSLNAGWKPAQGLQLTCGIDNLFDRAYAEHISRNASAIPGYLAPALQVNEPGRMLWVKAGFRFSMN